MPTFSLIFLCVLINTAAQILLKKGMNIVGNLSINLHNLITISLKVAMNPYILAGMFCYIASVIVWLIVLSRVPVSYAYPLISLGYITTCIAAAFIFNETITTTQILGIVSIITGVFLIAKQ